MRISDWSSDVCSSDLQDIGLDADRAQLLDGVLRRLGLQLARRGNEGHQRAVDVNRLAAPGLEAELADRFEERQALDVADRAADLDQHEIDALAEIGRAPCRERVCQYV